MDASRTSRGPFGSRPATAPGLGRPAEFILTERPRPNEEAAATFRRLAAALRQRDATLVALMVYGAVAAHAQIADAIRRTFGEVKWPITWIEGASCDGSPLAGVQAFAVTGRQVRRITLGGRVVGSVYEDGTARHCLLGGMVPPVVTLPRPAQAQQLFGSIESALDLTGFTIADVVRTWFYNDDILAWYGDFNRVRTGIYKQVSFRTGSLPASTGIGARNTAGAALEYAAWAVQPLNPSARIEEVGSPLQCPAPAYGSSFSRAMELATGGMRRLFVSGTASIHPDGQTAWIGNIEKQIELTMNVVEAILESRRMEFTDVTRATAYFRDPTCFPHFERWCAEHDLLSMPCVSMQSVICRDDLLWEIEVDACVTGD